MARRKYVRVLLKRLHRRIAVKLIQPQRIFRTDPVSAKKLHKPPQSRLTLKGLAHFARLGCADALDLSKLIGVQLKNVKSLFAEAVDDESGGCGTYAPYRTACKVLIYIVRIRWQQPYGVFRFKLPSVLAVQHPRAFGTHRLARRNARKAAHDRGAVSVVKRHAYDCVSVLVVSVHDRVNCSV